MDDWDQPTGLPLSPSEPEVTVTFDIPNSVVAPNGGDLFLWVETPCTHSRFRRAWDNLRGNDHGDFHYREVAVARAVSGPLRPLSEVKWSDPQVSGNGETLTITYKPDGTFRLS